MMMLTIIEESSTVYRMAVYLVTNYALVLFVDRNMLHKRTISALRLYFTADEYMWLAELSR